MAKARTQAYRLTHEQLYLSSAPTSVLPRGAAPAAFDNLVRFHRDRAPHPAPGRTGSGGGRVLHRAVGGSRPGPRLVHLRTRLDPPPRRSGRRGCRAARPVDLHPPGCAPHRAVVLAALALPRCQTPLWACVTGRGQRSHRRRHPVSRDRGCTGGGHGADRPAGGKIPRALDFAVAVADSEMADEADAGAAASDRRPPAGSYPGVSPSAGHSEPYRILKRLRPLPAARTGSRSRTPGSPARSGRRSARRSR